MNTSHMHVDPETGKETDAYGLREYCNICRKAKGLKELTETEAKMLQNAGAAGPAGSGAEPVEQLLADLKSQEDENDQLRGQLKERDEEIARLQELLEGKKKG